MFNPKNNNSSPVKQIDPNPKSVYDVSIFVLFTTYMSYGLLLIVGYLRDFVYKTFKIGDFKLYSYHDGYAPIVSGFGSLYQRRIYFRINDCFQRPITGIASKTLNLVKRNNKNGYSYNENRVFNLSSYNYLGFAQNKGPCVDEVIRSIEKYGICSASCKNDIGSSSLCREAEELVARFVGKPSSLIISQGFSTNSTVLPALLTKGSLIISDELNHSSIIFGSRLSGACIKTFKHNDMDDLEKVLVESIVEGQSKTHKAWRNIMVVVEGLYSMEGSILKLPHLVELKRKYKFYIYMDEAHSIGAMGPRGKGICDYFGIDSSEIDIMMGTFTKSFGSAGGYIAANKDIIDKLKVLNYSHVYGESISIPVLQQIITSMKIILGEDGTNDGKTRLEALAFNSAYFSKELKRLNFPTCGDDDSPISPLLLFHPAKVAGFSRECLKRNIAVVTVGYPATPIMTARARFCLSSSHTKEDLDWALKQISEVGDLIQLKN